MAAHGGHCGIRTHQWKYAQDMKMVSPPCSSFLPSPPTLPPAHNPSQVFPFYRLITINHDPRLRLILALCLHLSGSTPLRKTLTVNHYLHSNYFEQKVNNMTQSDNL